MPKRMTIFVTAILVIVIAAVSLTARTSIAQLAADECITKPNPRRLRAATGIIASIVRRAGSAGIWEPKGRKYARVRPDRGFRPDRG